MFPLLNPFLLLLGMLSYPVSLPCVQFAESLVPTATIGKYKALPDAHSDVRRKAPASGGCNIAGFVLVKKVRGEEGEGCRR